jgi:hypothetical protein
LQLKAAIKFKGAFGERAEEGLVIRRGNVDIGTLAITPPRLRIGVAVAAPVRYFSGHGCRVSRHRRNARKRSRLGVVDWTESSGTKRLPTAAELQMTDPKVKEAFKPDPLLTPEGNMANAIIHLVAVMDRIESHLSKIANSGSKRDDF